MSEEVQGVRNLSAEEINSLGDVSEFGNTTTETLYRLDGTFADFTDGEIDYHKSMVDDRGGRIWWSKSEFDAIVRRAATSGPAPPRRSADRMVPPMLPPNTTYSDGGSIPSDLSDRYVARRRGAPVGDQRDLSILLMDLNYQRRDMQRLVGLLDDTISTVESMMGGSV